MDDDKAPLIILGGRDRKSTVLPEKGRDKHVLRGYKAVEFEIGGRPLILEVIDRFRASGAFDPIYVAGPRSVYQPLDGGLECIDTDGSFGENLAACAAFLARAHPGRQVMFTTCDILPEPGELRRALDDYLDHQPVDFWMPQCRVPEDRRQLGQSSWKPKYQLRRAGDSEATEVLPGHLVAVDPQILRIDLVCRFFGGLYRTRNRSIAVRARVVAFRLLRELLRADLRQIARGHWPTVTWDVAYHSIGLARRLARGIATPEEFEVRLRKVFVTAEHRRRFPERRGRVALIDGLSLAKDIDTLEEARELGAASP